MLRPLARIALAFARLLGDLDEWWHGSRSLTDWRSLRKRHRRDNHEHVDERGAR